MMQVPTRTYVCSNTDCQAFGYITPIIWPAYCCDTFYWPVLRCDCGSTPEVFTEESRELSVGWNPGFDDGSAR